MPPSALAGGSCPQNRVDQLATGDHPVGAHREDAEDGLLPGLAHAQFLGAIPDRYRAEHADTQYHGFADPFVSPAVSPAEPRPTPGRSVSEKVTVLRDLSSRKNLDHLETSR